MKSRPMLAMLVARRPRPWPPLTKDFERAMPTPPRCRCHPADAVPGGAPATASINWMNDMAASAIARNSDHRSIMKWLETDHGPRIAASGSDARDVGDHHHGAANLLFDDGWRQGVFDGEFVNVDVAGRDHAHDQVAIGVQVHRIRHQ